MPAIYRELAVAQAREMFRDLKTLFTSVLYPFVILAIFLFAGSVTPGEHPGGPSFTTMSFAMTLFICVGSVGFFGIATPLVALRERGTLRLLSTTPLRRATLLAAQAPSRVAVALGQLAVIIGIGVALGAITPGRIPMLLVSCLLGLAVFGALGYVVGGRAPSAEATSTVAAIGLVVLMFASGLVFPLDAMPGPVQAALRVLPTTYLGDLLSHFALGLPAKYPIALGVAVILGFAALLAAVAVRTFRWDAGERA